MGSTKAAAESGSASPASGAGDRSSETGDVGGQRRAGDLHRAVEERAGGIEVPAGIERSVDQTTGAASAGARNLLSDAGDGNNLGIADRGHPQVSKSVAGRSGSIGGERKQQ